MRKGLTVCAGELAVSSAWAVSAAVLPHLQSDLFKPWERTLLLGPEVKPDYGQSMLKILGE